MDDAVAVFLQIDHDLMTLKKLEDNEKFLKVCFIGPI